MTDSMAILPSKKYATPDRGFNSRGNPIKLDLSLIVTKLYLDVLFFYHRMVFFIYLSMSYSIRAGNYSSDLNEKINPL